MNTTEHEHSLYETKTGWKCRLCGELVMAVRRMNRLEQWALRRELKRELKELKW